MTKTNEKITDLIEYSAKGILSKAIVKNDTMNVTLFSMAEGTEMSEHTSTKQGFIYVVEGDGVFNLEGEDISMTAGAYIHMNENAVHSIKASGNTSFVLVLTKP